MSEPYPFGSGLGPALRAWFRTPPRRHGEVDEDRTVSFLELYYDLVFVVLIAQVAHTVAEHVSWSGVADFAVVFGLIWLAWLNGSMYHEVHGREDGRAFALTYALLLAVLAWQWWSVRRHDTEPA